MNRSQQTSTSSPFALLSRVRISGGGASQARRGLASNRPVGVVWSGDEVLKRFEMIKAAFHEDFECSSCMPINVVEWLLFSGEVETTRNIFFYFPPHMRTITSSRGER